MKLRRERRRNRPKPTSTSTFTATPEPAAAEICLTAFDDRNGNGIQDADEQPRADVAFTVTEGDRVVTNYISSTAVSSYCIDLEPGNYQVVRSRLPDEELTTAEQIAVALTSGDSLAVSFGSVIDGPEGAEIAQEGEVGPEVASDSAAADDAQADDGVSPLIGLLIAVLVASVLLLAAVLLIVLNRRTSA